MRIEATLPIAAPRTKKPRGGFVRRALMGGRLSDLGRLPRYMAFALLGCGLIWAPITGYLKTAPLSYKSSTSLILPGSGASASLNLSGIGQASSYASSAFASSAVSPTETYKRLLNADRILAAAAQSLGIEQYQLGSPRVQLVDQTSLIHVEMTGRSPVEAQARANAILDAFFTELDALRSDEVSTREYSGLQAIADYRDSVASTRSEIASLQNESGLLSVAQYAALVDRHLMLEAQVLDRAALLSEKSAAVARLEAKLGLDVQIAAATLKLFADSGYLALLAETSRFEAELAEATAHYGTRHPEVQAAQDSRDTALHAALGLAQRITGLPADRVAQLDLAPQGARAELLAELLRMDAERAGAAEEHATLLDRLENSQADLNAKAAAASELQDLERDFSVAEAVFASAIARAQSSKSDVYASYPLVQVLENPSLPERPSSPNRKLAFAAGIAATFMLFVSLIMGWVRLAVISRLLHQPSGAK
ncbi:MAG: hypothetical protein NWQ23_08980 [Yoonia sp.]|uniref:GumC family protein n=1 Tax=Yoonia sp. TaxID=2212373 RepID=UPI00273E5806|nr:hypothetical protein [Yoonia sp.]MDP5085539.1 hypothetical protein [Yoonia sp.]MDP5362336.1 hypothetical protein [Paracoccaceae bacterium]